ncbi:MAG: rRNA maturation RNase YbeY [Magnetococcales bacterium]|nr:rRNA maturation RNase YbeY [Magnetococcales bacterium]
MRHAALIALDHLGGFEDVEVGIRLTDDAEVRELNDQYRGRDRPTNILSFAMYDDAPDSRPPGHPLLLGDLVVAYETVVREAQEQGKTFTDHLNHLVVHGILHLAGYDHERSAEDALSQENLEIAILSRLGIANPYE